MSRPAGLASLVDTAGTENIFRWSILWRARTRPPKRMPSGGSRCRDFRYMLSLQKMGTGKLAVMPLDVLGRTVRNDFAPFIRNHMLTFYSALH